MDTPAALLARPEPRPTALASPVTLVDGTVVDLATLELAQLRELHWQQERAFARRVLDSPKGTTPSSRSCDASSIPAADRW